MPMRGAQFGQFADPAFGAALSPSGGQGVLPEPGESTSASDTATPQPSASQNFWSQRGGGGPGLMPSPQSNPGTQYLAEGGEIDDGTQDSGNAAPAQSDPFGIVKQALNYGRKKLGLPQQFYGAKPKSSNDPAATKEAMDDEGVTGGITDPNIDQFSKNQFINNMGPDESTQWGDTEIKGKDQTAYLAEGGEIEEDTGTTQSSQGDDQGVIPTDADGDQDGDRGDPMGKGGYPDVFQGGGQGQSQQKAMSYLKGEGGVGPEVAMALERQVDPQGRMNPNMRKALAVARAPDPDKQFQVLQHYRSKFNAYNAVAKAAAQGAGGRPPDLRASAQAATQAYQHLPDGEDVTFMPTQGGMRIAVKKVIPSQPAPSGGEDNTQPKMFAEGGEVEEDDGVPQEQPLEGDTSGVMPQQSAVAPPGDDPNVGVRGRAPHEALRDFVLSVPQYLSWLTKGGQADSVFDKGIDATLAEAAQSPMSPMNAGNAVTPQQGQGQQQPMPAPQTDAGVTSQRPMDQGNQNPLTPPAQHRSTPKNAEQFGAKVGTEGGQEGATLADVLHEIDQAYPSVGMSQQRALARAAARQHWADNRTKIEAEQTKGAGALERAKVAGGSRVDVANTNQAGRITAVGMQQEGAGQRNANTNDTRRSVAQDREGGLDRRFTAGEAGRNDRAVVAAKPSVIGNQEKMDAARKVLSPGQQQPQPQGGQDRAGQKLVNGKWYKRGPNGEAVLVP